MKDQELRDLLHAYHPELSDEETFMDKLTEQMDAVDEKQNPRVLPLYRKFLPWMAGIAAAIVIALLVIKPTESNEAREAADYSANIDYQMMLSMTSTSFPTFEETVAEIEQSGRQLEQTIAQLKEK